MTDYKTLRVPEDAWKEAKEQKEAAGRTWAEQIVRPDGEPEGVGEIMRKLEQIESAQANTVSHALQVAEDSARASEFPTTDMKEALREVLREELPEGALR